MITGQVIFREAGTHHNGKHLMMVVGIIAVPEGELKGEHQYVIDDLSILTVHKSTATDLTEKLRGWGLGHTLTEPMWRV